MFALSNVIGVCVTSHFCVTSHLSVAVNAEFSAFNICAYAENTIKRINNNMINNHFNFVFIHSRTPRMSHQIS